MKAVLRAFWYYTLGKHFRRRPSVLTLFVTNQCNARCQHCFYWQNLESKKKEQFPLKSIKALSQDLDDLELLLISGGEPFLRNDLPEIVKIFWENNQLKSLSLPTNCLLPKKVEEQVEKILRISPCLLVVIPLSLDGTEEIHDQIRGVKGNFKKVQETYFRLVKLSKKYPNLRIRLNATVFDYNYESLFELIDQLPELFPDSFTLSLCLMRGEPRNQKLKLPSTEKIEKLYNYKMKKFRGQRPWNYVFMERFIMKAHLKILKRKNQVVPCESGRLLGVVFEDGTVAMCEDSPNQIGSLNKKSFQQLWESPKAKRLRKRIAQKKCWCSHEVCLYTSLVAHPLEALRVRYG